MRILTAVMACLLGVALILVMLGLPPVEAPLPALVNSELPNSGVSHPVTAVLLNFRGYDTLLEIGVLLLAVLGMLTVHHAAGKAAAPAPRRAGPVLATLTQIIVPLMVLVAGYLLWAGAHQPGGAFQAGAVLAAAGVLLRLSGRLPPLQPQFWLRVGLLIGFAVFLAVALGTALGGMALLEYPVAQAGAWILLIESTLTLSIALVLVSLFIGAPAPADETAQGSNAS